jgi:VanZ family protein
LRNLTVGQEGADLIVRIRTPDTDKNGLPPYRIEGVFAEPGWRRILIHIMPEKVVIRIDGDIALSTRLPEHSLSGWSPAYRLALGNEFTFDRPWLGRIRQASIAVGTWNIDYSRGSALYVPQRLSILKAHYVLIPFIAKTLSPSYLSDFFVNLFGFIPLGILLMIISKQRLSVFRVTILSAVLSLSIELGQLFLSGRVTETEDFILNTLGGMIGAWLYQKYTRRHDASTP